MSWPEEAELLRRLWPDPAPRVLELGCGTGAVAGRLVELWPDAEVTGLEPAGDLLEVARQLPAATGGRLRLVQGSIEDNALPRGGFDLAVARYVFQHLADPVTAAGHALAMLKPGGGWWRSTWMVPCGGRLNLSTRR
jgi:SAM-dependent methyltransferase